MISKNRTVPIFLAGIFAIFLWPLIGGGKMLLLGDYEAQFYPWAVAYQEALAHGALPWWEPRMGAGFPLLAEGQVAAFYPLHLVTFSWMPAWLAYHLDVLIHWALSLFGTYLFARKVNLSPLGAVLAAITFAFGSALGGMFYNLVSLRTLSWFPWTMIAVERLATQGRKLWLIVLLAIFALELLAGFPQFAVYAIGFTTLYGGVRLAMVKRPHRRLDAALLSLVAVGGVLAAMPQLIPTLQLARESTRAQGDLAFALWGSWPPWAMLTAFFPRWNGFLGRAVYLGIPAVWLVIYAVCRFRAHWMTWVALGLAVLSLLLALGQFNPIYVLLVNAFHWYSLRVPSKLIVFALFWLALLAGIGVTLLQQEARPAMIRRAWRWFALKGAFGVLAVLAGGWVLQAKADQVISLASNTVSWAIGQGLVKTQPMPVLVEKLRSHLALAQGEVTMTNGWTAWALALVAVTLIVVRWVPFRRLAYALVALTLIDLYVFSLHATGYRGNLAPMAALARVPWYVERIQRDPGLSRVYDFYAQSAGDLEQKMLFPNEHLRYGLNSVGAYSPLMPARYRALLGSLGGVDDATGMARPDVDALQRGLGVLRLLNVKYVTSPIPLDLDGLELIEAREGIWLYQLRDSLPRAFLVAERPPMGSDLLNSEGLTPTTEAVTIVAYQPMQVEMEVTARRSRWLVFSDLWYPGWKATIDGRPVQIEQAYRALRAIPVPPGRHRVTWRFRL